MTQDEKFSYHARDSYSPVEEGFLQVVNDYLGTVEDQALVAGMKQTIHRTQADLEMQYADFVKDEQSRYHLHITALVLAAYRVLQEIESQERVLELLHQALIEPCARWALEGTAYFLDHAADPFSRMVEDSKQREEQFFGSSFEFERERDDRSFYLLNVKRCFYHDFFVANHAPELTKLFCEFDWNWAAAIDSHRHRFRFQRPCTLGYGQEMCSFQFLREKQ